MGAVQVDDLLPYITGPDTDHNWLSLLRNKVVVRRCEAADQGIGGFAVVQDNDADVPQVARGFLDVTQQLHVAVLPVD